MMSWPNGRPEAGARHQNTCADWHTIDGGANRLERYEARQRLRYRLVTAVQDRLDAHDLVRLVVRGGLVCVRVLEIDARGARDFVVDCPRKPSCIGFPGLAFEHRGLVHQRESPWRCRDMVPELPRALDAASFSEFFVLVLKLTMYENSICGFRCRMTTWSAGCGKRLVRARPGLAATHSARRLPAASVSAISPSGRGAST
jgi:hypothetical protein